MPPCGAPALPPFAVEHVEHPTQRTLGLRVVREPPGRFDAAPVGIEVLDLHALVEAVLGAGAPEAGPLDASPRRLPCGERVAEVVDPHHAGLDAPCDPVGLRKIARPHARGEPELRRIRAIDGFVLAVERLDGYDRAEDLLVGKRTA